MIGKQRINFFKVVGSSLGDGYLGLLKVRSVVQLISFDMLASHTSVQYIMAKYQSCTDGQLTDKVSLYIQYVIPGLF